MHNNLNLTKSNNKTTLTENVTVENENKRDKDE